MSIFKLPDLGEGLPEAEIVEWHVNVGDEVKTDQPLVSMETAKAVVEVPSPQDGKIEKLHGQPGDTILTGAPLVEFNSVSANSETAPTSTERKDTGTVAGKIEETDTILEEEVITINRAKGVGGPKATPAVRALARKLKVDLNTVSPTGPRNTITAKDVQNAVGKTASATSTGSSATTTTQTSQKPEGYEPLKGVRKAMAQAMVKSHQEVVPVTVCDDAKLINWTDKDDITIRVIQAVVAACKKEPALNAFYDGASMSRKIIDEINLGLAMDTKDGLFVPVIKDVANKTGSQLREELNQLKVEVQNRTVPQDKLHGATITLSNFGKFAGRYANPIVVPPQVAIIGAGAIKEEPIVIDNEIKPGRVMPLAVTFDHRAVTGGEATRFLGEMIEKLL